MSSKLKVGEVAKIEYTKDSEVTERVIIPITVPSNIKAIDVTALPGPIQDMLARNIQEYGEYIQRYVGNAFKLEEWLLHSKGIDISPKWRTLKPEQTKVL
jgi:hypothetical protein